MHFVLPLALPPTCLLFHFLFLPFPPPILSLLFSPSLSLSPLPPSSLFSLPSSLLLLLSSLSSSHLVFVMCLSLLLWPLPLSSSSGLVCLLCCCFVTCLGF